MKFLKAQGSPDGLDALDYGDTTWDKPWNQYRGQISSAERMPSYVLEPSDKPAPLKRRGGFVTDTISFVDKLTGRPIGFTDFLQRRIFSDGLLISHQGDVVFEEYFNGVVESDRHLCHSCTKTLTTMQIGIAIHEGRLSTDTLVRDIVTELSTIQAWNEVTVQHLLDMATGIKSEEHYENPASMYYDYADAVGYWGPKESPIDGAFDFATTRLNETDCPPGSKFNYASYNTNLFPVILERLYGCPAVELYESNLFRKTGPEFEAILNADQRGLPIVEGHLNLTLRDFFRWGYLIHSGGKNVLGEQVIPSEWVTETLRHSDERRAAFLASDYATAFPKAQYHNQIWVLDADQGISAMLGIYGQFFYSDRTRDITITGFSSYPDLAPAALTANTLELWDGITEALCAERPLSSP